MYLLIINNKEINLKPSETSLSLLRIDNVTKYSTFVFKDTNKDIEIDIKEMLIRLNLLGYDKKLLKFELRKDGGMSMNMLMTNSGFNDSYTQVIYEEEV